MVELVPFYGCEVWLLKREEQRKLLAQEMDYLRRSARMSSYKKSQTQPLGAKCKHKNQFWTIQRRQMKWYIYLFRIEESLWPRKIYHWTPHGRSRRGRPQQS